ncbi:hypothetical protein D3C72_1155950 [compost metagenome]
MRQLVERVHAVFGPRAGVRCLALHRQEQRANAAGGQVQRAVLPTAFKREDGVLVSGECGDQLARSGRADFLIAVEQHGDLAKPVVADLLKQGHAVQHQRHALLLVFDAQAIGPLAVDAKGLLRQIALVVDRVHVGDQHDPGMPRAFEYGLHGGTGLLGRILQAFRIGAADDSHLAPQGLELVGRHLGDIADAGKILAARFDVHQRLQRVEQRLPLGLRCAVNSGLGTNRHGSLAAGHGGKEQGASAHHRMGQRSNHRAAGTHGAMIVCTPGSFCHANEM